MKSHFLGIDIGTQGARAVVMDPSGELLAEHSEPFDETVNVVGLADGHFEQRPEVWIASLERCLASLSRENALTSVKATAVTSTSGTVVPVNAQGQPTMPAIMYRDTRASAEAVQAQEVGAELTSRLGYRFNSSYGLPKVMWIAAHAPAIFAESAIFLSPADYIAGWLSGDFTRSDDTNMFKTGYDVANGAWPSFLSQLGVPLAKLPTPAPMGTPIGTLHEAICERFGMGASVQVCSGLTDGCASQVSTGAVAPGDWCTTIGTTLVIKGVSKDLVPDPEGRIYSHRHPDGHWLPGGASNIGAGFLSAIYGDQVPNLSETAAQYTPSNYLSYPLAASGERFPFVAAAAEAFFLDAETQQSGSAANEAEAFCAHLEGISYIERLAYETLEGLGLEVGDSVYTSGGGSRSAVWMQMRADILKRQIKRPAAPLGAVGAAVVAASRTHFDGLQAAAAAMVKLDAVVTPGQNAGAYDTRYQQFVGELKRRSWLKA